MATYHLSRDNQSKFYWILKSDKNGRTVVRSSESYDAKEGALKAIEWNRLNAKDAKLVDHTTVHVRKVVLAEALTRLLNNK